MLTGQETIDELMAKNSAVEKVLSDFGVTRDAMNHLKLKNLAHAAVVLQQPLKRMLEAVAGITGEKIRPPNVSGIEHARPMSGLRKGVPDGIKNVIAVHSGKGGVGKTFVAVNLAVYLADKGLRVGLLDADIDCPNVMKVLKLEGKLIANCDSKMVPLEKSGLKVVSMAPILRSEDQAILWRGPVISRAIEQLIHDTAWGILDFLIIDLPPGTGDVPITVLDILAEAQVIVVTTPQELAVIDAKKSINMARSLGVKVCGLIENMAGEVFGGGDEHGAAATAALQMNVPFLGAIKLRSEYLRMLEDGAFPALKDEKARALFAAVEQKIYSVVES